MMTKGEIRRIVWARMEASKVTLFPGAKGRIPNFKGAKQAAGRLARLPIWKKAVRIKINPDSAQYWVRRYALEAGKTLYMAVPRLKLKKCFIELNPRRIRGQFSDWQQNRSPIGSRTGPRLAAEPVPDWQRRAPRSRYDKGRI